MNSPFYMPHDLYASLSMGQYGHTMAILPQGWAMRSGNQ